MSTKVCRKCNGTGTLPAFFRVEFGKCFACDGKGTRDFAAERAAKADHAARLRQAETVPTAADVRAALQAAAPEMRKLRTRNLAACWRNAALADIWGETVPADVAELAAEADRVLTEGAPR